jgi:hypothetical protein
MVLFVLINVGHAIAAYLIIAIKQGVDKVSGEEYL